MIFQVIGDPTKYKENVFIIDGERYKAYLSSDAVRQHLESMGEDLELIVFIPESFLIGKTKEDFCESLSEKVSGFEIEVIPSIGTFSGMRFEGSVESVITAILLQMVERKPKRFYVDITTGFNLYPVSLLEAAKRYLTYRKLEKILQSDEGIEAFTIFSPPILGDVREYVVEIHTLDAKAFFSLPNADIDSLIILKDESKRRFGAKVGKINKKYETVKSEFRSIFRELRIAYNAISLNVPLAFYEFLEMVDVDGVEKEIISFVEALLEPVEDNAERRTRLPIDGVNVANVFYSLALYKSIREFGKTLNKPEVNEIYERFKEIYRRLGINVNEYFLQRDVEDIISHADKLEEGEEILGILKHGSLRRSGNEKRNFFAHSGFLEEYTIIEKRGGSIYVRWDKQRRNVFKDWLFDPS